MPSAVALGACTRRCLDSVPACIKAGGRLIKLLNNMSKSCPPTARTPGPTDEGLTRRQLWLSPSTFLPPPRAPGAREGPSHLSMRCATWLPQLSRHGPLSFIFLRRGGAAVGAPLATTQSPTSRTAFSRELGALGVMTAALLVQAGWARREWQRTDGAERMCDMCCCCWACFDRGVCEQKRRRR